jgi:tRNA/tmRNA/rRNA uracil-C5-methylase (TrmA/RlmC/RlmD family)
MSKAECPYFGACGGCSYQDRPYAEQLEIKRKQVAEALSIFGCSEIRPTISSPKPFYYRHMIAMTVQRRHNELVLGFVGQNHRDFIPIEFCAIADERLNQYLPKGLERLCALPPEKKFHTSQIVLRAGDEGEVVTSLKEDSKKTLECSIQGKQFSYRMSSFFQHNVSILGALIEAVRSLLRLDREAVLFDLYCGVGIFGISLANDFAQVFGLEEGYEAIQQANANAKRNSISNIYFEEGKVEDKLHDILATKQLDPDGLLQMVIDPPRVGLKPEVIKALNAEALRIERLVYVSCELSALARDLKLLTEKFKIEAVQPIDLFPQTKHIETIVSLAAR